jgi:serine/threonine-protein kinase
MAPSRIAGRYDLEEQLGEGGMGVVWRAFDIKMGGYVAIKLMKDISDPMAVELFTKEWKALAEMSHPNIVEVRDVDVVEENRQKKPLFVMPLLRGATLAELIASASARLTLARIVEITTQVCKGLQAAHQRGLVHRDLKPSNIFVMDDDTAKIIDFGVVHLAGSKSVTGQKGTFQYMSPEQAQLKDVTPASDLFSLGVILYEALTLRKPFARNTAEETMQAVITYIPPSVSEINPSINQSVSKVVHKCLAKQPIHRFASARELAETLQKAFRNEPIFDSAKIEPRIERAKTAFRSGDEAFASEILAELEAEGILDPRITVLRMQIEMAVKQKKIRQLLESARARMEQDEIPLALDKLREVLELDPENSDALAMRETMQKQRSEAQIAKWLELAEAHLGNRDFGAARHAVQEVLAIRGSDSRALDLLEKIESTEADAKRIREQKEQLYGSAMKAFQEGEIDSALSKLERLFSVARSNPYAAIPERDAVYQSFYKEVRSEHDSIHSALEEAQRQFGEKNFAGAMAVCKQLLANHPHDGTFQALKIRIEDAERQELSSYIAEVSKRVESEPDLDRRANILREACERYPSEAHFGQQLKLIRERRDLVNSIVAKARQYEERGQYSEAISQWDILRNIHPQYPGIAFELEQCKSKRDRQAREEEQARLVEEIDGLMDGRAYAKAIECANAALREFPGDTELTGLLTLAEQGMQRAKESRRLLEEGQLAIGEKDLVKATDLLRSSLNLDPRGPGLRDAMVNVLAERARTLVEENWRDAEPMYQEASELDPNHPAVRALRSSISEGKRQASVGQCLTEARVLVANGNWQAAVERVRATRAEYPNDPRLEQYGAGLLKEVNEIRRREERGRDRAVLSEDRRALQENPDRLKVKALLERSQAIRAKHPDDSEIEQSVAEIELAIKRVAKVDDLSEVLRVETGSRPGQVSQPEAILPSEEERKRRNLTALGADETRLFQKKEDRRRKETPRRGFLPRVEAFLHEVEREALAFARPAGKWSAIRLGALGGSFVLIAVIGYLIPVIGHLGVRKPTTPVKPPVKVESPQYVHIRTIPADSTITDDGKPVTDGAAAVGATVEVSHLGYITKRAQVQQESDGKIVLEPEPVHLSIQISAKSGTVELDGQKISDLTDGSMDDYTLVPDGTNHKLSVISQEKPLFAVDFQATAGSSPQVTASVTNDFLVVTSLGKGATVYGGNLLRRVRIGDQTVPVLSSGADLNLTEQSREISFGEGTAQGSIVIDISNAPALRVHSLTTDGQLKISTDAQGASLTVDGVPAQRKKSGWLITGLVGFHTFVISAEGYPTQQWTMTLQRGQRLSKFVPLGQPLALALLDIQDGTPGADVYVNDELKGQIDANGKLPIRLKDGVYTVAISKQGYERKVVKNIPVSNHVLFPHAALTPTRP